MKWLSLSSITTLAIFTLPRVLAEAAEEECWRGPAMRLGGVEYFETLKTQQRALKLMFTSWALRMKFFYPAT
ncbi:hypothetical protein ColLi_10980 [Colletotrichum liriopes]|uniref:Secreted protein n=1 Tax=Colletotrichum liriopes TaxID=708192 RepID=A0AA37GXJ1_9PEZI|nr:hypothetical protein ColLi_10980 [Colletotrichum liriopes]